MTRQRPILPILIPKHAADIDVEISNLDSRIGIPSHQFSTIRTPASIHDYNLFEDCTAELNFSYDKDTFTLSVAKDGIGNHICIRWCHIAHL